MTGRACHGLRQSGYGSPEHGGRDGGKFLPSLVLYAVEFEAGDC